ncbi:MAG: hypothetical protein Q8L47_02190 [bacterium]|nr:hypothetical protein [bacterium]
MADDKKHDPEHTCGHPDFLRTLPWLIKQREVFTPKDLAESHCECCGSELVIRLGFESHWNGVNAIIECPNCFEPEPERILRFK